MPKQPTSRTGPEGLRARITFAMITAIALVTPTRALAHVKWFSEFSYADRPLTLADAVNPTFIALAVLSAVVIGGLVAVDRGMRHTAWHSRIAESLEVRAGQDVLVMRIGAGAVLLLSWQADSMLVPELGVGTPAVGWFQFALAFMLLFQRTVPLAGVGLIGLYALGIARHGPLHMLDYLAYAGAGYFLAVSNSGSARLRESRLPALYAAVGFSLCWVALEKVFYPQWGLYVLQENPQLALGFDLDFFLLGAAFVEFALGYLLIINLLQRPMALLITLVFFSTTLVFGKTEVIGHTLIHAALVVFVLQGSGRGFRPPIAFHRRESLRIAFASVNFVLLLVVLSTSYAWAAQRRYEAARQDPAAAPTIEDLPTAGSRAS